MTGENFYIYDSHVWCENISHTNAITLISQLEDFLDSCARGPGNVGSCPSALMATRALRHLRIEERLYGECAELDRATDVLNAPQDRSARLYFATVTPTRICYFAARPPVAHRRFSCSKRHDQPLVNTHELCDPLFKHLSHPNCLYGVWVWKLNASRPSCVAPCGVRRKVLFDEPE